ncbi:MAG: M48 family metallopeptidase, partial [Burkholderiaceae bacterium]|nr:M48 family metallopeptidase [Burkholderiaceae bacterium]
MRQLAFDWLEPPPRQPPAPAASLPPASAHHPSCVPASASPAAPAPHFAHPRASREIALANAQVAYEFRRSKRRTIGFAVSAEGLCVSAPRWTPLRDVEAALHEKARWIVAKLQETRALAERQSALRIDWREGAQFSYLGEAVLVVIDPRQRHGPAGALLQQASTLPGIARLALHVGIAQNASPTQLRDAVQAWLMRQARRHFTARLDHFAPQLGVQWHKLALSGASTRWGSACASGAIRLNWRLIHLSAPLIDYVVAHELAHLREMNHSPRFWQVLQSVMPDYAARRS